jgi:hypothetical protein
MIEIQSNCINIIFSTVEININPIKLNNNVTSTLYSCVQIFSYFIYVSMCILFLEIYCLLLFVTYFITSKLNFIILGDAFYSKGFRWWCITLRISGFLDFVHHPIFYKLESITFRKLDLFPSSGEGVKTPTQLGRLERANLSHWSPPSPEDGNRSSFQNVFSSF